MYSDARELMIWTTNRHAWRDYRILWGVRALA